MILGWLPGIICGWYFSAHVIYASLWGNWTSMIINLDGLWSISLLLDALPSQELLLLTRQPHMINMADSRVFRSSYIIVLFFRGILYDAGRLSFKDRFCFAIPAYLEFGTYYQPWQVKTAYLIFVPAWNNSHHDSKVSKVKGYLSSKVGRYPNSASTFQMFNHQWSYLWKTWTKHE